jgi:hypothetical protein
MNESLCCGNWRAGSELFLAFVNYDGAPAGNFDIVLYQNGLKHAIDLDLRNMSICFYGKKNFNYRIKSDLEFDSSWFSDNEHAKFEAEFKAATAWLEGKVSEKQCKRHYT